MIRPRGRRSLASQTLIDGGRSRQRQVFCCRLLLLLMIGLLGGTSCSANAPSHNGDKAGTASGAPAILAFTCAAWNCRDVPPPIPSPPRGPGDSSFDQGTIDLTGDGIPELVRREGAALIVLHLHADGEYREVWRTPEAWQVVDAALGDPNDNGRFEIMVAFWRDDPDGTPRSHPFIVGYREGSYREVWGGSPVAEPIYELALADVDGDGAEDLIVLDAARVTGSEDGPEGARTISVWRWHGWGFTLMWRSAPGHYRDLVVLSEGEPNAIILVSGAPLNLQ